MTLQKKMEEADLRSKLAIGLLLEEVRHATRPALARARQFLEQEATEARKKTPSTTIPAVGKSAHA